MAYTYLTLGSWERDIGTCNALTVLRGKQKRKIFSFSFSPANRFSFYSLLTKHTCTCTYLCLCCLFRWGKGHTYLGNYSRYQEWNSFLYLSCEASTNLRKANSSLTDKLLLCLSRNEPHAVRYHSNSYYHWRFYCVLLLSIRAWSPALR